VSRRATFAALDDASVRLSANAGDLGWRTRSTRATRSRSADPDVYVFTENEIQHLLGSRLAEQALEVDNWKIALPDMLAADDFPGAEVDRSEGWGTVGRLAGSGDSPSWMLNAHVDVVPAGDLRTWSEPGPLGAPIRGDSVQRGCMPDG
jgi:acetylornithine deacetylase/succinyl-diaminopimelate desuccinylase-like protein